MADNKPPNPKRPGEKKPGTFHYNPGNMAGKEVKDVSETERTPEGQNPAAKKPSQD